MSLEPSSQSAQKKFTCFTCKVLFKTQDIQRAHHKSDWHRYNLKRKVADLPPISVLEFENKIKAFQSQKQEEMAEKIKIASGDELTCSACKKTYSSRNAYENHLSSKKHHEVLQNSPQEKDQIESVHADLDPRVEIIRQDAIRSKEFHRRLSCATTEQEIIDILDEKSKVAIHLDIKKDCLFCIHQSEDLENNMEHMAKAHSFFIPDIEYLVDLEGLLEFLGNKLTVYNICLYCNGKGKAFHSLEAVRKHMLDKGHTKLPYDGTEDEYLELSDYYDFSETWEGKELTKHEAWQDHESGEWHLPNGNVIGHRSLRRYYRQNLRPYMRDEDEEVIDRLAIQYQNLGLTGGRVASGLQLELIKERQKAQKTYRKEEQRNQRERVKLGVKTGKLQRYFRPQVDF